MEIYLEASKTDSGPFLDTPSPLNKIKGEPLPEAVGDNVPKGGRSGEAKPRTGGPAGSPPGRFVGGPAKPEQAPTPCHLYGCLHVCKMILMSGMLRSGCCLISGL